MKGIDTGKDKVKKICDVLKKETLEPAKKEAEDLIKKAKIQAESLLEEAKKEALKMREEAMKEIEKEKNVFQSSLNQACKQALETVRQEIELKLFNPELAKLLDGPMQDPKVVATLTSAIIEALGKEGLNADLNVLVPKAVPAKQINDLLAQNILQRLKGGSVQIGSMQGGVQVKVEKNHITVDVTDAALKELVASYIRKDFREILFRS